MTICAAGMEGRPGTPDSPTDQTEAAGLSSEASRWTRPSTSTVPPSSAHEAHGFPVSSDWDSTGFTSVRTDAASGAGADRALGDSSGVHVMGEADVHAGVERKRVRGQPRTDARPLGLSSRPLSLTHRMAIVPVRLEGSERDAFVAREGINAASTRGRKRVGLGLGTPGPAQQRNAGSGEESRESREGSRN